jgi:hypothetical protein
MNVTLLMMNKPIWSSARTTCHFFASIKFHGHQH